MSDETAGEIEADNKNVDNLQDNENMETKNISDPSSPNNTPTDMKRNTDTQNQKIEILLKATADAPIMKKKKWAVKPSERIGRIVDFIRSYLKLEPTDSLFLYVNQAFAPSPDQEVRNLYECFGSDGKLVLHYAKTQAWG